MPLCGSTSCGCAIVSTPATTSDINGSYPSIDVAGAGTSAQPWNLSLNDNWAAEVANWGIWKTYTGVLSTWTVGNGTLESRYAVVGGTCFVRDVFTPGTTSTMVGSAQLDLPITPAQSAVWLDGFAQVSVSSGLYPIYWRSQGGVTQKANAANVTATYLAVSGISATIPFTWLGTSTHFLTRTGSYEINPAAVLP